MGTNAVCVGLPRVGWLCRFLWGGVLKSPEIWVDTASRTAWERSPEGAFSLVECRGQAPASVWSAAERAVALNCPSSLRSEDGAGAEPVYFPPAFRHSPATGAPLDLAPVRNVQTWLPPSGGQQVTDRLLRGAKLTPSALRLAECPEWPAEPADQLPLPPPGGHKFLVAPCGYNESFLFVLDPLHGCIYCWAPSAKRWVDMNPAGPGVCNLDASQVALADWWPECEDLQGGAPLLWPSDEGILTVRLDPLCLTYTAEILTEGACVSSLVLTGDRVSGILRDAQGALRLVEVSTTPGSAPVVLASGIAEADWSRRVSSRHLAVWISEAGQVAKTKNASAFIPWPPGVVPAFEFGPPYCGDNKGELWQQVLASSYTDDGKEFGYLKLGLGPNEYHRASCARHHTGHSSIKVEQRLEGAPWLDPETVPIALHENDEAVIPILESGDQHDLLVLRANHVGSAAAFLDPESAVLTRFQIYRQQADALGFHSAKIHKPWETIAFVYCNTLYLHHPEFRSLPGWRLQGCTT